MRARRFGSVLFWSVISAAFIGPGTVTTCARAGVDFRMALLWAVLFSTAACYVLQEASARLAAVSGHTLAAALRERSRPGPSRWLMIGLVFGAIVVGCAAYQAGNLLGASVAALLATEWLGVTLTGSAVIGTAGGVAALLLWTARTGTVARIMGLLVAVMGLCFLVTALLVLPPLPELLHGLLLPAIPRGSALLVVGLIGTTVVPYNLFLGSGLARGRELGELRFGLAVAIGLGGLISMGVLVVGAAASEPFSFVTVGQTLQERLGGWAGGMFAGGLFAAGLTSAITAPLAAAVTARGLFERDGGPAWDDRSLRYRMVWGAVLAAGLVFALRAGSPVEVIVVAQALNGILLPLVAVFLLLAVNDRALMADRINGLSANVAGAVVIGIAMLLGVSGLLRASATASQTGARADVLFGVAAMATVVLAIPVARAVAARRR